MLRTTMGIMLATALVGLAEETASAQEYEGRRPYLTAPVAAPSRAFELGVSAGYAQGFGQLSARDTRTFAGRPMPSGNINTVAGPGAAVGLNLGYRANPYFRIGWTGQLEQYRAADQLGTDARARGVATSIDAALHFNPYERTDPWISIGAGHRAIWAAPTGENNNVLIHGLQLARVQVGIDLRPNRDVALGPVIGADVDMFFWRNPEGPLGNQAINGKRVSTFVYAGMGGTFDLAGTRAAKPVYEYKTGSR